MLLLAKAGFSVMQKMQLVKDGIEKARRKTAGLGVSVQDGITLRHRLPLRLPVQLFPLLKGCRCMSLPHREDLRSRMYM